MLSRVWGKISTAVVWYCSLNKGEKKMSFVIVLATSKGGAGKTTLATCHGELR